MIFFLYCCELTAVSVSPNVQKCPHFAHCADQYLFVNFRYPRRLWTTKFGRRRLVEKFHTNQRTCRTLNWHGWWYMCISC